MTKLDLRGHDLRGATLTGADLSHTLLSGSNLEEARLEGALLVGAHLNDARLKWAALRGSNLTEANLEGASLTGARSGGADLRGARGLTWDQVRDASVDCFTQIPTMLAPSDSAKESAVPMMLVLRDCFLPHETQIPSDADVHVLFGSMLSDPVVVRLPDLVLDARIPNRTQLAPVTINARPGRYVVTAIADRGSTNIEGALVATRELLPTSQLPVAASPETRATALPTVTTSPSAATPQATSVPMEATPSGSKGMNNQDDRVGCEPSYPDVCIPPVEQVGDLDCAAIGVQLFRVLPPDPHGFDGDFDGIGCAPLLTAPTVGPDLDCIDFATHEEAQAFYEAAGGPESDLYRLDIDGDGIACSTE